MLRTNLQGMHWLASHEPHWPKAKWPEMHHYHDLKPSVGLKYPDKVRLQSAAPLLKADWLVSK